MMLKNTRIAFVGSGAMAEAMIAGLLSRNLVKAQDLIAAGPRQERAEELIQRYGVQATTDNCAAIEGADIVVLSTKPQVFPHVRDALQGKIKPEALVLSILAGVKMETISQGLLHAGVVRAMPNTPARIGQGITVWTNSAAVTETQREQAKTILEALGQQIYVEDEEYLDMATALSGTGPGYVFLFMEALVDAGVHLGFSRHMAEQLVLQTVKGSVEYVLHSPDHLARLRNQVTSPGGTTAEALYYLERAGFRTALSRAVWAAYQRSVQLGAGKQRDSLNREENGEKT